MSVAAEDKVETKIRRRAMNPYARLMEFLSLRAPGFWRLRIDLLVLAGVLGVVSVLVFPGLILRSWAERFDSALNWSDVAYSYSSRNTGALGLLMTAFGLFGLFWVYCVLQPVRLRTVAHFQNRPRYAELLICVLWFVVWPTLIMLSTEAQSHATALRQATQYPFPYVSYGFWQGVITLGLIAAAVAIFAKSVLLSSLMRTIGAFFLAIGVLAGVGAIMWVGLAPVILAKTLFPQFEILNGAQSLVRGAMPIAHLSLIAIASWLISLIIFRMRRGLWVKFGLIFVILACLLALVVGIDLGFVQIERRHEIARVGPIITGPLPWLIAGPMIGLIALSFLLPYLVSIGADLRHGTRSKLTRPMVLSLFWLTPLALFIATAIYTSVKRSEEYNVYAAKGLSAPSHTFMEIIPYYIPAFLLSIVAIELLSRLSNHIASSPEP